MIGTFAFLSPWLLAALAALPLIWLLLRLTPPRPPQVVDRAWTIYRVEGREQTPARTPWWLTLIRLLLVALIIGALAEPVLRPQATMTAGNGPLLVVLDNGWDAAPDFARRKEAALAAIEEAGRAGRPVAVAATAEPDSQSLATASAAEAAKRLAAIAPRPHLPDRAGLAGRLRDAFAPGSVEALWLGGALDAGASADFAAALATIASNATLLQSGRPLAVLRMPQNGAESVLVPVTRIGGAGSLRISGYDTESRRIMEATAEIGSDGAGQAEIALPADLRNSLARFVIDGEESAGAVQLLDGRWRRKSVGLIVGERAGATQALLEPLTYVERALATNADLIRADGGSTGEAIATLIDRSASVIVLAETGSLQPATTDRLVEWIAAGGTLVRFASPSLAGAEERLLPAPLRQGERSLGGSLSWEEPQAIGSFSPAGPFADIAVPSDVRVERQVLADPQGLRGADVWAELADGTPLVTARAEGQGRIVLFHVTADPRWSNLPLSGAFVAMLTSIVEAAGTVATAAGGAAQPARENPASAPWRPVEVLDGHGRLGEPAADARLVADLASARASLETPPGFYDRDGTVRALNAVDAQTRLAPLRPGAIGWSGASRALEPQRPTPIWPWLLAAAALLAALDGLAVLAMWGRIPRAARAATLIAGALLVTAPDPSAAQNAATQRALNATLETSIAYVVTGNAEIDATSAAGLRGLGAYLGARTALEPGDPAPIDPGTDELAFYSLIYWPIDAAAPLPSAETMAKVDTFLKNGGTILFDTRDANSVTPPRLGATTPEGETLRRLLAYIDVPPLEPVPPDHVLTKAFYLLSEFPGRWAGSELWVESLSDAPQTPGRPARGGDGVAQIIITGNDLAGAWAVDDTGRFLYPTVPADPRQRETAFRAGVNIVMYTLTGNYKADQVHVPALLERLGQ